MATLTEEATLAAGELESSDEDQLYQELGIRLKAIEEDAGLAGSFSPAVTFDATVMGPLDGLIDLGKRIFRRWEKEAYEISCGPDAADQKDRQFFLDAFGLGSAAVAGYIAAGLVSSFALAPAIAAVVAALVVKRLFVPAYEEFCTKWGERIEPA